jgi:hypothetical protein
MQTIASLSVSKDPSGAVQAPGGPSMDNHSSPISRLSHLFAVGFVASIVALAGCAQPMVVAASYEDCILEHVETGMVPSVIGSITRACRSKFPSDADASAVALGEDELSRLAFRATNTSGSTLIGVVHNGNPDLTITEVDIAYSTSTDGAASSRIYRTKPSVSPFGTYELRFSVLRGDRNTPVTATVVAAKGRPAQ